MKSCQAQIDAFMHERKVKRDIAMKKKRALGVTGYTTGFSTATLSATNPTITGIKNVSICWRLLASCLKPPHQTACVLAPDVTEGTWTVPVSKRNSNNPE